MIIKGKVVKFSDNMTEEQQFSTDKKKPTVTLRTTDAVDDQEDKIKLKIPHMGWNNIVIKHSPPVLDGIQDNSFFYFVHSYYVVPEDEKVKATDDYIRDRVHIKHLEGQYLCIPVPS